MGAGPTGIDQSWGFANPAAAKAAGVTVVSMYLSHDASKNMTAADVKAYHAAGIGMLFNWEHNAGAPLNGAAQGTADAQAAVAQARSILAAAKTKPRNRLVIYFSCDRDVTGTQIAGPVVDYYRAAAAVCHAAGFGVGVYGEADLVKYLSAHRVTDAEWQTYAWSGGRLDPATDFYQYLNGQKLGGADVDFDRVIHPADLGALWPPGSRYDTAAAVNVVEDDPLADLTKAQLDQIANAVWARQGTRTVDGKKVTTSMAMWCTGAEIYGAQAVALAKKIDKSTTSISQVLTTAKTGVLDRVSTLGATLDKVNTAVAALKPGVVSVDAATVADAVVAKLGGVSGIADAVVAKVKALMWRAQ